MAFTNYIGSLLKTLMILFTQYNFSYFKHNLHIISNSQHLVDQFVRPLAIRRGVWDGIFHVTDSKLAYTTKSL